MSTFLAALKAKSAQVQSELVKQVNPVAKITDQSVAQWLDPTGTLQKSGLMQVEPIVPLETRIERVLNRNRLDVFFNRKPEPDILQALRDQCFQWDGIRKCWYHKDTIINRLFLHDRFNCPNLIDASDLAESTRTSDFDLNQAPVSPEVETSAEIDSDRSDNDSPEWSKYKKQVDALLTHLKVHPADLMLTAIDCLYTQTFKVQ